METLCVLSLGSRSRPAPLYLCTLLSVSTEQAAGQAALGFPSAFMVCVLHFCSTAYNLSFYKFRFHFCPFIQKTEMHLRCAAGCLMLRRLGMTHILAPHELELCWGEADHEWMAGMGHVGCPVECVEVGVLWKRRLGSVNSAPRSEKHP